MALLGALIAKGVSWGKQFISNAQVGKQFLASGGSITSKGTEESKAQAALPPVLQALGLPVWALILLGLGIGGLLLLLIKKLFK